MNCYALIFTTECGLS